MQPAEPKNQGSRLLTASHTHNSNSYSCFAIAWWCLRTCGAEDAMQLQGTAQQALPPPRTGTQTQWLPFFLPSLPPAFLMRALPRLINDWQQSTGTSLHKPTPQPCLRPLFW